MQAVQAAGQRPGSIVGGDDDAKRRNRFRHPGPAISALAVGIVSSQLVSQPLQRRPRNLGHRLELRGGKRRSVLADAFIVYPVD